jgi:hypothetical protein
MANPFITVFQFYRDGFRNMKLGKTLWLIIAIKLFVLFFILKLFFFPNFLNSRFETEQQKAGYVGNQFLERTSNP